MTSLSEVYEGTGGDGPDLRRLYLGTGMFLVGAVLSVVALFVATTDVLGGFGYSIYDARHVAGLMAGLGVPAMMVGVFVVLPTSRRIKAAAAIGAGISVLGASLFWYAYPDHWAGHGQQLTLLVSLVYAFGMLTTIWCLFSAIVNFKTRNDPGGTVTLSVTKEGETRVVEVPREEVSDGTLGGVGLLGGTPEGDVETQTNRDDSPTTDSAGTTDAGTRATDPGRGTVGGGTTPASDGGATTNDISSPMDATGDSARDATGDTPSARDTESAPDATRDDAEIMADDAPTSAGDTYCGNCAHFEYVRTENGMTPYCGDRDELMDDMEACDAWTPNRS